MRGGRTPITKEAKKNKGKIKWWADNLPARFPPSTSASEGGALFALRLPLALRPTPIWALCRLDLIPCSPFSESPFAFAPRAPFIPPLPFPRSTRSVIATPQIPSVTCHETTISASGWVPYALNVSSCQVHCLRLFLECSFSFWRLSQHAVQFHCKTLFYLLLRSYSIPLN